MFSFVSVERHTEKKTKKTPKHLHIRLAQSHMKKKKPMTKCSSFGGKKTDMACRDGVFGGKRWDH